MNKRSYDALQLKELLLQMMETELGGEQVYRTALPCAKNEDLRHEWEGYLQETLRHQNVVRSTCEALGIDCEEDCASRQIVKLIGDSLLKAMEQASKTTNADVAQLVACECVVLAETKDQANWELLGKLAEAATRELRRILGDAYISVANDDQHHLLHTKGWCRELWIEQLGMPAELPPPEEVKQVASAIGASRAEQQRQQML